MWKAVIPKPCSFWIKTPFLCHQNFASVIFLEGGSGQQRLTCCSVTAMATLVGSKLPVAGGPQAWDCGVSQSPRIFLHIRSRHWPPGWWKGNGSRKRPWNEVQVRAALGKPLCKDQGLWDWLADLLVRTLWNNGVGDTCFVCMFSGFLDFSGYSSWPGSLGQ